MLWTSLSYFLCISRGSIITQVNHTCESIPPLYVLLVLLRVASQPDGYTWCISITFKHRSAYMSSVRTTLGSVLAVVDRGGSALAGIFSSTIDGLDMLNNRIASAKKMQTSEIQNDEMVRQEELEISLTEKFVELAERADTLVQTKGELVKRATARIAQLREQYKESKAE